MSFVPGPFELVLILVVVLILFGAGRLPQVFESFGKGIRAFREASNDTGSEDKAIEVSSKPELDSGSKVAEAEEVKAESVHS